MGKWFNPFPGDPWTERRKWVMGLVAFLITGVVIAFLLNWFNQRHDRRVSIYEDFRQTSLQYDGQAWLMNNLNAKGGYESGAKGEDQVRFRPYIDAVKGARERVEREFCAPDRPGVPKDELKEKLDTLIDSTMGKVESDIANKNVDGFKNDLPTFEKLRTEILDEIVHRWWW